MRWRAASWRTSALAHRDVEEEREPGREVVDFEAGFQGRFHVGNSISQRERDFLNRVNIGMAISVGPERGGGLVVGVIRDADRKSLRAISQESKALAKP